jgi:hypothetical protein
MVSECCARESKKKETPARTQGFFQFQMVARGGIDQGLRMFDPSSIACGALRGVC